MNKWFLVFVGVQAIAFANDTQMLPAFPTGFICPGPEFKKPKFSRNPPRSYIRVPGEVVEIGAEDDMDMKKCVHGLNRLKSAPFEVWVCCGYALGNTLGIVLSDQEPVSILSSWQGKVLWQEDPWSTDVTTFGWGYDPCTLFVTTDEVYGDLGLYQLDVCQKTFKRLFPKKTLSGWSNWIELESISRTTVVVKHGHVRLQGDSENTSRIRIALVPETNPSKSKEGSR